MTDVPQQDFIEATLRQRNAALSAALNEAAAWEARYNELARKMAALEAKLPKDEA